MNENLPIVERFLSYLIDERAFSPYTSRCYGLDLRQFVEFLEGELKTRVDMKSEQAALDAAARDLRARCDLLVYSVNWYDLPLGDAVKGLFPPEEHRFGIHAGDIETSMMLALRPEQVDMTHARDFRSTSEDRAEAYPILGNGRSGKTSLLRALAKQPLQPGDAGPDSTVGVSVDTLQQQLKPGFLRSVFQRLPDITYWDFAGQLEYSAAHDFFLSSRQAVYVIIFSVMEDRDAQMHQVACVPALS